MKMYYYADAKQALRSMTDQLGALISAIGEPYFNLAVSGGGTAKKMFSLWADEYRSLIDWKRVRFYWVDERCVSPKDDESNYKHAKDLFFDPLKISTEQIFRIHGESKPYEESERYSEVVRDHVPAVEKYPRFHSIILGAGDDGHTASIFPDNLSLLTAKDNYAVSHHPLSGQARITMTGPQILCRCPIFVPIFGEHKKWIIEGLVKGGEKTTYIPVQYIVRAAEDATIFTDIAI